MASKPIRISGHARFEMKRRGISPGLVTRMIRSPGQVLPSNRGRRIYQGLIGRAGRLLLRVVVAEDGYGLPCDNRVQDQSGRQVLEDFMKVIYDKETDTLSIILRAGKVVESDEAQPGLILDYDKSGRLLSIELLDASEQVQGPQSVEFALAAG